LLLVLLLLVSLLVLSREASLQALLLLASLLDKRASKGQWSK
jgi:hypothetical protein